jgi:putative transposase
MTEWVLRWLSAAWTRLRQRRDLLLEFIALRHQLAVLQRKTGTRRPCFRPSERLFWLFLSRWWANWQRSLIIVQPATVLRWRRLGLSQSAYPTHVATGAADAQGSIARSARL